MPGTGKKFDVSLVTPDGAVYEGQAEMIIVPGQIGEIGVLARHAPLIATLKAGSTRVHPGGGEVLEFATGPGFFQVLQDRAIALVDDAVQADAIDDARAQKQLEDTIRGFDEILAGQHDGLPEQAFYMVGTIDGAVERGRQLAAA